MKVWFILTMLVAMLILAVSAIWPGKGKQMEAKDTIRSDAVIINLPVPRYESGTSVEKALLTRRSVRDFQPGPLTLGEIGQLLWAAQGITSPTGLRTAPSAGALYPLEIYVVAGDVTGLGAGVYHYLPQHHALTLLLAGDRRGALCAAAFNQVAVGKAPASIVFSAVFERTTGKYGKRGRQFVYTDSGHASENVCLQAVSLSLGTVVVGGLDNIDVGKALAIPAGEEVLSIMPVGRLKAAGHR